MRILGIIYEFPPIGGGGGQAAKDIAQEINNRGHEVRILTAGMKGYPHREIVSGMQVIRVQSGRRMAYKAGLGAMSGFVTAGTVAGFKEIKTWRPDIIHVHFAVPSGPVAWIIHRSTRIPYVLTAHLGDVPSGVPEKTERWFRFIYPFTHPIWRDAAHTVAVSEYTRKLALKHYPVEIKVIPNGVDLAKLDPGKIVCGTPPRIFFAGRFMPQKNPLQLIQTLAELRSLDWQCVMLGDGPLRREVEAEIARNNMNDRFTLTGWVTPDEVIQWLKKSDILFMPSLSEGLPVIGVQSLAMGLAIVATKAGGFIDLIDQGVNGELLDLKNTKGFKRAIEELLINRQLLQSYRESSRKKSHFFDIKRVADNYEKIFLSVLT
jgi:L-malate glycosyltransferase